MPRLMGMYTLGMAVAMAAALISVTGAFDDWGVVMDDGNLSNDSNLTNATSTSSASVVRCMHVA